MVGFIQTLKFQSTLNYYYTLKGFILDFSCKLKRLLLIQG